MATDRGCLLFHHLSLPRSRLEVCGFRGSNGQRRRCRWGNDFFAVPQGIVKPSDSLLLLFQPGIPFFTTSIETRMSIPSLGSCVFAGVMKACTHLLSSSSSASLFQIRPYFVFRRCFSITRTPLPLFGVLRSEVPATDDCASASATYSSGLASE